MVNITKRDMGSTGFYAVKLRKKGQGLGID